MPGDRQQSSVLGTVTVVGTMLASCIWFPAGPGGPEPLKVTDSPYWAYFSDVPAECAGSEENHGAPYTASALQEMAQYEDSSFQEIATPRQKADLFDALATHVRTYRGQPYETVNLTFSHHIENPKGGHVWTIGLTGNQPTANQSEMYEFHFRTQDPYQLYIGRYGGSSLPRSDGDAAFHAVIAWNETHNVIPDNFTLHYLSWDRELQSCLVGDFRPSPGEGFIVTDEPRYWAFIEISTFAVAGVLEAPPAYD